MGTLSEQLEITLNINGVDYPIRVEPRRTIRATPAS